MARRRPCPKPFEGPCVHYRSTTGRVGTTVPDLTGPRVSPLTPPLQLLDGARSWAAAAAAAAAVGVRAVMSGGGAVECGCGRGGKR